MRLKKNRKKKNSLKVTSSKTGVTHIFEDLSQWEPLVKEIEKNSQSRRKLQLLNAFNTNSIFKNLDFNARANLSWNEKVFRIVHGFSPTSIAGSLADGGRFNIGGSQQIAELSSLKKFGGIYCSTKLEVALKEIAQPIGEHQKYEMSPKKIFKLWDLKKVLEEIPIPGLEDQMRDIPVDAIWGYQKVPLISQILGFYLKNLGGDGILFPSTKVADGFNIFFFFNSDRECELSFDIKMI